MPVELRWLLVLVALFVVAVIAAVDLTRSRSLNQNLGELARQLDGRLLPGGFRRSPLVEWTLEGLRCLLTVRLEGAYVPGNVAVSFQRPCPARLRLTPESGWWSVRKFFGAVDVLVGDPAFDREFVIQAQDAEWARRVLAPEVRAAALELARAQSFSLNLGPAGIVIRANYALFDEPASMRAFARRSLALGVALHLSLDPPVVIAEFDLGSKGICPVCATAVEGEGGLCSRCRTPHHKDCWNYLGGCAIFGCAGRPRRIRGRRPGARVGGSDRGR